MIKKREKLNNSALAQIESGSSSRKFTSANSNGTAPIGIASNGGQNVQKIYN